MGHHSKDNKEILRELYHDGKNIGVNTTLLAKNVTTSCLEAIRRVLYPEIMNILSLSRIHWKTLLVGTLSASVAFESTRQKTPPQKSKIVIKQHATTLRNKTNTTLLPGNSSYTKIMRAYEHGQR